ncbi:MAG: enoyl-CoA hydratase/isomerase family protein [Myxococcales bacterium]|nr:enoyl-CoA hydratase/isomerase family protein [Myxococcales bacterium]
MSDVVLFERDGGIGTLTINRPQALNALDSAVLDALEETLAHIAELTDLRVLIITGAGGKAFVAGADIAQMSSLGPREARRFAFQGHRVLNAIESLPVPVIAAVNGYCLGGGCELSLACDLVYAGDNARFGQPEVKLGLIPGFGGTQRLARRIGAMAAAELIFSGRMVKADEAKAMGLCLDVFPAADLLDRVRAKAAEIASQGPVAVRLAKTVQARGAEAPLATANAFEREAFANLFDSADAREGMQAFLEKRAPAFRNE